MPRPRLKVKHFVPIISPQMFVELIEMSIEQGIAPERLCAGLGCSVEALRRGERISARQAWRIIRRALRLSGRPDLGLELGFRENFSHFGLPRLGHTDHLSVNMSVIFRAIEDTTPAASDSPPATRVSPNLTTDCRRSTPLSQG